jgi:hypothetical protein
MEGWTCPRCGRLFARAGQGHDCEPGMSLDEYFATGPAHERPVFEAVLHHVETLGPVHADVVAAGIFLKNPRRFVELRPMTRWVAVSFKLPRHARHRTIVRTSIEYSPGRWWHTANVASPADLDDALLEMLTEAYLTAAGDD